MSQPRKSSTVPGNKANEPKNRLYSEQRVKSAPRRPAPKTAQSAKKTGSVKKNAGFQLDKGAALVCAIILVLVILLIVNLTGSAKVKQVTVKYAANAKQKAAAEQLSDVDFIRQSGVMNKTMNKIDAWSVEAKDKIAQLNGYVLTGVSKTSSSGVELQISVRTPYAVLSTGGSYVTIDKEKYIIDKKTTYKDNECILVDGVSLRSPTVGQIAADAGTDDRLENALYVINVLNNHDLRRYFSNIHMLSGNEVRLVSTYNISVILNLWFKDSFDEDIRGSVQVLNEKGPQRLTGWIYAVNGNITWHEDEDYFSPIKGK